jgi:2-polyprenyl-3-methyl-5-hydroxy-6-metoxy-1,4-benzoquinol methylase
MKKLNEYWQTYYSQVHSEGHSWLDYSNQAVQMQSFALTLESVGQVVGKTCLDVGSGNGQFARCLVALGATQVTAVELIAETVEKLQKTNPEVIWRQGDAGLASAYVGIETVDLISALEVLQYVEFAQTIERLWSLLRPGGRLVGVIPNANCPIVAKATERFSGYFRPVCVEDIISAVVQLPELESWSYRGMTFANDQSIAPYVVSLWTSAPDWEMPPNRFQFVIRKR